MRPVAGLILVVSLSLLLGGCTSPTVAGGTHVLGAASTPCNIGNMNPAERFGSASTLAASTLLGGHVPRWVPLGFGIATRFKTGGIGPNGYIKWTDGTCRRAIWLRYLNRAPDLPMEGVRFGRWMVSVPAPRGLIYEAIVANGTCSSTRTVSVERRWTAWSRPCRFRVSVARLPARCATRFPHTREG